MLWVLIRIASPMSTHNIGFYEDLTKIIIELSSNTHLISSGEQTIQGTRYLVLVIIVFSFCQINFVCMIVAKCG